MRRPNPIKWKVTTNNCWICTSHKPASGGKYPRVYFSDRKKHTSIARIFFELTFARKIPDDYVVRHKCDNTQCINPWHIQIGTHQDNVLDRVLRDRTARAQSHCRAKITNAQAKEIYLLAHSKKFTQKEIGTMYGISRTAVEQIKLKRNWRRVIEHNE